MVAIEVESLVPVVVTVCDAATTFAVQVAPLADAVTTASGVMATPDGPEPTVTVAPTVLVAVSMTLTVCKAELIGDIDPRPVGSDGRAEWVSAHHDGGADRVGGGVDHAHVVRREVGDVRPRLVRGDGYSVGACAHRHGGADRVGGGVDDAHGARSVFAT